MKKRRTLSLACSTALALSLLLSACTNAPAAPTESNAPALYTPGTYSGTAQGYGGELTVAVEVDASKILNVEITVSSETDGIGSKAVDALPQAIVDAQSTEVDDVASATMSSTAIKNAVDAALKDARGESSTPFVMKAGIYTSEVYGNNDYLNVSVTVDDSKIVSVEVPKHSETKFMGATAIEMISKDVVEYQTLNVDSVAGATVTSTALNAGIEDCLKQSGADLSAFRTAVPTKGEKKSEVTQESADVIVIGAGGAGLSAAVTATEGGAKVIVLEKMPIIGGNTLRCASAYNAADPARQTALPMTDTLKQAVEKALDEEPANDAHKQLIADVKAEYDAYLASGSTTLFDCPEWHALQTYLGGDKVGIVPLIRAYAENVLPTLEWMQSLGTPVTDKVSQGAGALWQRTHQIDAPAGTGLVEPLYNRATELGVDLRTCMTAESLILDGDKVVGVKATDAYGSSYEFMAAKGVIIATGGYSNNTEMRQKSSPALTPDMVSTNQPGATGDGILMAAAIGAGTTGMDYVQVYPLATPGSGALQGRARMMSGLDDVIDVNKDGKRFVNEDARRDDFVAAIKQQPDAICYDINDSTIVEELNSFDENVETLVALGRIYKADTLAGLEEQLGIPTGNLQATVDAYNKMVADKNDPEFGRKLFDKPIEVGPFYATPRAPSIHHTMGGLLIDTDTRVLKDDGTPISGLYAAGEVTGGIHGSNRLGGNATADVLTFGRLAGLSALEG